MNDYYDVIDSVRGTYPIFNKHLSIIYKLPGMERVL